jgi:general secretion pathway protein G
MLNVTLPLTRPIRRRRKGFSFIEVMVVIMILGLLVGIVGVSLFDSASQATVDATKTQIRGLETALDLYRLHNGRYPTTDQKLSALLERPEVGIIPKKLEWTLSQKQTIAC